MHMLVAQQAKIYITNLETRKRDRAKPATVKAYNSYINTWILPEIGDLELGDVKNSTLKSLVAKAAAAGRMPATIAGIVNCVKGIVQSAVGEDGEFLYPHQWNNDFVDAPPVRARDQEAPTMVREAVQEAISRVSRPHQALYVLLAGTGLRISEALAVKKGLNVKSTCWDSEQSKIVVKTQIYEGIEQSPKTDAGFREVDLAPELNDFLRSQFASLDNGKYLFADNAGLPLSINDVNKERRRVNIPGFHSFRRFRVTHLRATRNPEDITKFWIGHADRSITDRYSKMAQDIEMRKKYAAEIGVGFEIPCEEGTTEISLEV